MKYLDPNNPESKNIIINAERAEHMRRHEAREVTLILYQVEPTRFLRCLNEDHPNYIKQATKRYRKMDGKNATPERLKAYIDLVLNGTDLVYNVDYGTEVERDVKKAFES